MTYYYLFFIILICLVAYMLMYSEGEAKFSDFSDVVIPTESSVY